MSKLSKYVEFYNRSVKLPGSGNVVTIKPLTTNLMKGLLLHENQSDPIEGEEIIDNIIESSVVTEDFKIDDLYIQDKYFLFIEIRKATKGDFFQFLYTCPECNNKSIINVDLKKLKVTNLKQIENSKIFILNDKVKLELNHITRGKQKEAYNLLKNIKNENEKQIEMILGTLAQSITKITTEEGEEELDIKEKIEFLGELPESEYNIIND